MSEFTVTGTIKTILPVESGTSKAGKEWSKINFIVSNNEGYENREQEYCFQIFGEEKVDNFLKYNSEGDGVEVKFDIQTNEYNGKYFTNLSAFRVGKTNGVDMIADEVREKVAGANSALDEIDSDLPF